MNVKFLWLKRKSKIVCFRIYKQIQFIINQGLIAKINPTQKDVLLKRSLLISTLPFLFIAVNINPAFGEIEKPLMDQVSKVKVHIQSDYHLLISDGLEEIAHQSYNAKLPIQSIIGSNKELKISTQHSTLSKEPWREILLGLFSIDELSKIEAKHPDKFGKLKKFGEALARLPKKTCERLNLNRLWYNYQYDKEAFKVQLNKLIDTKPKY